jgi:hypothetical protein
VSDARALGASPALSFLARSLRLERLRSTTEGQPSEEMKPRHLIPILICALPIAYPLSVGPVTAIAYKAEFFKKNDMPKWWYQLYSPLLFLRRYDSFEDLWNWYIPVWIHLIGTR